jgi:hypothetical protein
MDAVLVDQPQQLCLARRLGRRGDGDVVERDVVRTAEGSASR